jgi:hypothetical protein
MLRFKRLRPCRTLAVLISVIAICVVSVRAQERAPSELCVIGSDGSGLKIVAQDRYFGSPMWSHDNGRLTYDAWTGLPRDYRHSRVFVAAVDGTDVKELGPGAMPSWSPDDQQIACHTYGEGVVVISADGS